MRVSRLSRAIGAFILGITFALPAAAQEGSSLSRLVDQWIASPHGDYSSESFTHWNEDGAVPVNCAACHSGPGFSDFLGADGSAAGVVDHPAPINAPVDCAACHTSAAETLDTVSFPSGVTMSGLGSSAICSVCHQGRQSTDSVEAALEGKADDTVDPELGFLNIHYAASAATLMGSDARGGYQYPGKSYAGRFMHVPSANTCTTCHEPHTTEVATEGCVACHQGIEELSDIRTRHADFDGDGDTAEGIHGEIMTLHGILAERITAYAADVAGTPIIYDSHAYPYYFTDTDGDGTVDDGEAAYPNRYQSWTPRLLRAAYNYQVVAKDPGGYSHNPQYFLQLLYDSIEDLSAQLGVETGALTRP
ncbi:polyheme membrane-associated cytochrome C [Rhodovulum sp. YNF3179]|uniref:polyheme membrane-associated cytochrome C n=1 Tax=Rhodovulum sp. YNF3179 TaxID=3425127 RepID=UPI003D354AB5